MKQTEQELEDIQNQYYEKHSTRVKPDGTLKIKRDNALTDLSFISRMNVKQLYISRCVNISFENMTSQSCEKLMVNYCELKSLNGIYQFNKLKYLNLSFDKIRDLSPLRSMIFLDNLNVEDNAVVSLSPLSNLFNLKYLYISFNQITNLYPIRNLSKLVCLYATNNKITDLNGIEQLKNMNKLYLQDNMITDINPLSQYSSLTQLNLQNNQITDITPLRNYTLLKFVSIDGNYITDLQALKLRDRAFKLENQNTPNTQLILISQRMKSIFTTRLHLESIKQKHQVLSNLYSSSLCKTISEMNNLTTDQLNLSNSLLLVFGMVEQASQ
ncbi:leucine-rich_repeat domain-containing protein [Hexamita inflata]|uniref:Leucine-rich repeat domain-containing protein n=1 Tax=Hexamita inflata TaxID=28002 RepID=A0AA86PEY5_9EUKA|nr:leucine-rich repeat domain-containing protein [Hexamita inflata]